MTNPTTRDALLHHVANKLIPLFEGKGTDSAAAKAIALSAIAAYAPEARADFVNVARILAFSMATLSALGIAAAEDLPLAQKMRYFGRANGLNRSADQAERAMMQRRRDQRANPPDEQAFDPDLGHAEPPLDYAAIDAAVDEAMAAFRANPTPPPAVANAPAVHAPGPRPAPPAAARPPGTMPLDIHYADVGPHPVTNYRRNLLQRTALQRVVAQPTNPFPT